MDRMKTFLKYAIWVILFFFFSNFIISVGLNSSYKKMSSTSSVNTPRGVEITEAESTLVNGKIKLLDTNLTDNTISAEVGVGYVFVVDGIRYIDNIFTYKKDNYK